MNIGVVSDTHSLPLPKQLMEDLAAVDLVIHAGDFCTLEDAKSFAGCKSFKAVHGNMDDHQVVKKFPRRIILDCEDCRVGVFHGEGPKNGLLERVQNEFKGEDVQVVVFGHSHQPFQEEINGVLYFNPGSPNDDITAPFCAYGLLTIKGAEIKAKIIKIK